MARPKLIYVVTEDWYFLSHRMPTVHGAQAAGYEVCVITSDGQCRKAIEAQGVRVIPFNFERRNLNPARASRQISELRDIYSREKPSVVHHIAMKPILYGSVAAWMTGVPHVVNAFAGLGYVFSENTKLARAIRLFLVQAFRMLLKRRGSVVMLQNPDDLALLKRFRMLPDDPARVVLIRGSGVDIDRLKPLPMPPMPPDGDFICAYAGRMIEMKGLSVMKDAFARLKTEAPHVKLWLCGQPDPGNPGSWTMDQIEEWTRENPNVIYKGQSNMAEIWAQSHVALQPSYGGEGVPKALLEAAACARPIIATDVPGCREVVDEGRNGFLVPPRNPALLAERILTLAHHPVLCFTMGQNSRKLVEGDLSSAAVTEKTRVLYESLKKAA